MKPFTCAVVGATGMVGKMLVQILEERKLPVSQLHLFASPQDAGQVMRFNGREITIEELTPASFDRGIDTALFAVSNALSRTYAPLAVKKGCTVVDNSSAWRLDPAVPLVVPEVNRGDIATHRGIIANPNCCAAPTVVALKPLHDAFGVKRVVISTYQSVSGAGVDGWQDLTDTLSGAVPKHFPYPIAHNLIPHIDAFEADGYTGEEKKLMAEVRKMLHLPDLAITATTVRVPVYSGHSLSINVTFDKPFALDEVRQLLGTAPGVILADNPAEKLYPMPITAAGNDHVHIGRLRRDDSYENSLNLWVVSDNIRKGAATNAVQIVEEL
ncbi:MAG: aspartate-semialdehyde dehydrogenase [Defluviitaleaceae bacterium]|nr:aspartate-semialdehyde dehydrogenase [Defluviitaleaceae bacterium]MCL2240225.1 aspartate-semialdehyde dehydrogenase [Defluviitaleaceae bacterium]